MLLSRSLSRACAVRPGEPTALSRGFAKLAKRKKVFDLGWEPLIQQLTAVPVEMPRLEALKVVHAARGAGQTGARKFQKELLAPLRYQNPEAVIEVRVNDDPDASSASAHLVLSGGESHEVDITHARSTDILRAVLTAAGVEEVAVESAVQAAKVANGSLGPVDLEQTPEETPAGIAGA